MLIDFQQGCVGGDVVVFADWNFSDGPAAALSTAVATAPQYGTVFLAGGGRTGVALAGGAGPGFPVTAGITASTILDENGLAVLDENGGTILSDP